MNSQLKDKLRVQLERDEGRKKFPYPDPENPKLTTIGIGRNLTGEGLSDDEIDYLCNNDINRHFDALAQAAPWIEGLDDARLGALVNMCFEMGVTGLLQFHKGMVAMQVGDYATAAVEFLDSSWAREVPNRAHRVTTQISTGEWQ